MKHLKLMMSVLIVAGMLTTMLVSCNDDEAPAELTLQTLTADAIDLNGVTGATGVPVDATIVAKFSTNVDPTTTDAITLTRDYDDTEFPATITVSGNEVTITPDEDFSTGSLFILNFGTGLKSTAGKVLTAAIERNFTTEGSFAPAGVIAHWNFENNVNDVVGDFDPTTAGTDITYVDSRNAAAGKAASFNGTTSIIEVPNGDQLMANQDFALSFWMKVDGSKEGHFVMGLGAWYGFQFEVLGGAWTNLDKGVKIATRYQLDGSTAAEDTWWNGSPNGWQGSTFSKDVSASGGTPAIFMDKWAHVVCMYNASEKIGSMFVNGEKVREWDFDLWPDGDAKKTATGVVFDGNMTDGGNNLAIGFIQAAGNRIVADSWADPSDPANNHFKGLLDDIRVYNTTFNATAVLLMYNSEKP